MAKLLMNKLIILMILFLASNANAQGISLKIGECATKELTCYDQTGRNLLIGKLRRGKTAEATASKCLNDLVKCQSDKTVRWYKNKWFFFYLGITVGIGSFVGIRLTL